MSIIALADHAPDTVDELLAAFIEAAREQRTRELERLLGKLAPTLQEFTEAAFARSRTLFESAGLQADDVYSVVLVRAYNKPPTNPRNRSPRVAVRAWVNKVATNYARDMRRKLEVQRRQAEAPPKPPKIKPSERRAQEIETLTDHEAAEWCAENRLSQRRHLREVFYALRDNARITGMELARAAGLVDDEMLEALPEEERMEKEKKLSQHAWQLRRRTLQELRACLAEWVMRPNPGAAS